jgi:phenylacetate-CoA ligase
VLRGFSEIAEYQVEVDRSQILMELKLCIEPQPDCAPAEAEALASKVQQALHNVFNLRVPVALAPAGSLPRFEMKAKRWKYL